MARSLRSSSRKENRKKHNNKIAQTPPPAVSSLAELKEQKTSNKKSLKSQSRKRKSTDSDPKTASDVAKMDHNEEHQENDLEKGIHNSDVIEITEDNTETPQVDQNSTEIQQSIHEKNENTKSIESIAGDALNEVDEVLNTSKMNSGIDTTDWKANFEQLQGQYQELKRLRFTEPEDLLNQQRKLSEELVETHKVLVGSLQAQVKELQDKVATQNSLTEQVEECPTEAEKTKIDAMEIIRLRKEVVDLREESLQSKREFELLQAASSTDAIQQHPAESSTTSTNSSDIVSFYEQLTSTKVVSNEGGKYDLITYNKRKRQAIKYQVSLDSSDCVSFKPIGNKELLPEFLQEEIEFGHSQLSVCFSKILQSFEEEEEDNS